MATLLESSCLIVCKDLYMVYPAKYVLHKQVFALVLFLLEKGLIRNKGFPTRMF